MKITCSLEHEDYLQLQMYLSSINSMHKKNRNKSRWLVTIIYCCIGFWMYNRHESIIGVLPFILLVLMWMLFYPKFSKWRYRKHFSKHIKANYQERMGKEALYDFQKSMINIKESGIVTTIEHSEIDHVCDMSEWYYLALVSKVYLVIPKRAILDEDEFNVYFTTANIDVINYAGWKW